MKTTFQSYLLSTLTLLSFSSFLAQPTIEWQKSLGGTNNDSGNSIEQTSDGGYIVVGNSMSNDGDISTNLGGQDFWVVKLDAIGTITWEKSYAGGNGDYAFSVQQTTDGGYIVAGYTTNAFVGSYYWVIKLDALGNMTWDKPLGGTGSEIAYSIEQTTDGGYIVAGSSNSTDGDVTVNNGSKDYWVVKLNSSGNITWEKSLGGSSNDIAYSVKQTIDGGYIVAGHTESIDGDVTGYHGNVDIWVVKLNSIGTISWQKCLGGSGDEGGWSDGCEIQPTSEGGYIVAGYTMSTDGDVSGLHGGSDYWVVKLDNMGNITWQKCLGGLFSEDARSVQETVDGGFIVAGYSESFEGDVSNNQGGLDYWIVKLSITGALEWEKSVGGTSQDEAKSIRQTSDGGFIVVGKSGSLDGDVTGNHSGIGLDYWVVKLSNPNSVIEEQASLFSVYPNPFSNEITITVDSKTINQIYSLTDQAGRIVLTGTINSTEIKLNLDSFTNGLYLFQIDSYGVSKKIIKR